MSSSHTPSNQSPYGYDASRRRSLGGGSPPNPYGGKPPHSPSHEPPPPPPSFARSHMPPPLSPQQQQHPHASQAQRPPYSAVFGGRELPGLGHSHRPGSSMSISSLIGGGDTGAPAQTSQSQSSPHTNAPSSNSHSMQPPSPRHGLSSAPRSDFQPFRRQPSPDRHMYGSNAPRAPENHNYNAASPTRSYGNQASPDQGRPSQVQSSQPYKPMVFQGQRPYAAAPNDAYARDSRQLPANVPPRPNSQPMGPGQPTQQSPSYDSSRRPPYGPPEERRRTLGESHHVRPNVAELVGDRAQASDRDRPSTVQPVSHSTFSPPRDQRGALGPNPPSRTPWRQSIPEEPPRDSTESRREEPPPLYRGYGGYSAPPQGPSPFGPHGPEDMVRGRSLDHLSHRATEQYHAAPTSDPNSVDRQKSEQLSRSLSSGGSGYPGRGLYDQYRRIGEDLNHAKSLLAFGPDVNRRTGRASPLPQAVQGAQAQPLSIGKDPHVKSEFGRMFSGLGGLGSSTPSRGSPMPQGSQDAHPPGADLNEHLRLQRVNSQNGRKPKRVKDEDGGFEHDDMDGRGTPLGSRGAKRNKHAHPGHHHHHHAHHHHHHHHKPDEEQPLASSTPFGGRQHSVPQNGTGQSHHHHHYHGAPHHHHHAPRPNQPNPPSPKLYPKIHDIQAVLDEAAEQPRRHLGSHLYEATTELPKPNSSVDDQFGYASKPKRLPRFDMNPINCTFTIRVPRFYLRPRQRQQIVLQQHLWGAQVYRDDSDPIAAAIHCGWIRGEWDETVDANLLDPRITAPHAPSDAEDVLHKPPVAPVNPPADMDLQIDILILPRIQEYASTVEYGVKSRKSKTHDGLSFAIHKIRWVDEDVGSRGQERTAAAMKRRLDASATLLSLLNGRDEAPRAVNGTARLHA
ncbi:Rxt3-domain-containing protein [Byssothecium circinans]|uniref:Rxt3-domain-containing protein n=1 Tax=Byssothecium circinans TaxID=147558 RepID=A0A6A5UH07_9PLEO|nr:Rxt3-domain-containing protein [Byssothecium circinans]